MQPPPPASKTTANLALMVDPFSFRIEQVAAAGEVAPPGRLLRCLRPQQNSLPPAPRLAETWPPLESQSVRMVPPRPSSHSDFAFLQGHSLAPSRAAGMLRHQERGLPPGAALVALRFERRGSIINRLGRQGRRRIRPRNCRHARFLHPRAMCRRGYVNITASTIAAAAAHKTGAHAAALRPCSDRTTSSQYSSNAPLTFSNSAAQFRHSAHAATCRSISAASSALTSRSSHVISLPE